jgi:hypothetical protein
MKGEVKSMDDIKLKYIIGNETMELAEQFGSDLFETWIVSEIDKVDMLLDDPNNDVETYNCLQTKKSTLEKVREAYRDLKE